MKANFCVHSISAQKARGPANEFQITAVAAWPGLELGLVRGNERVRRDPWIVVADLLPILIS